MNFVNGNLAGCQDEQFLEKEIKKINNRLNEIDSKCVLDSQKVFLNFSEAAIYLSLDENILIKMVKEHKIPCNIFLGRLYFKKSILNSWFDWVLSKNIIDNDEWGNSIDLLPDHDYETYEYKNNDNLIECDLCKIKFDDTYVADSNNSLRSIGVVEDSADEFSDWDNDNSPVFKFFSRRDEDKFFKWYCYKHDLTYKFFEEGEREAVKKQLAQCLDEYLEFFKDMELKKSKF